jgi:excisionase family DNA binding protein
VSLDDCPPVLRVQEAAEVALVDAKTLRRAIHRGELPALIAGRVIRIHRDALTAWLMGESNENRQRNNRLAVIGGQPAHGRHTRTG